METAPLPNPGRPAGQLSRQQTTELTRQQPPRFRLYVSTILSSWSVTINHVFASTIMASKAATAAVVRPSRCAVKLRAVFLTLPQRYRTSPASIQPSVSEKVQLFFSLLPKSTSKANTRTIYLLIVYFVRNCRSSTGIPQAALGCPAHLGPAKCPTDDRRPCALPLCPKE